MEHSPSSIMEGSILNVTPVYSNLTTAFDDGAREGEAYISSMINIVCRPIWIIMGTIGKCFLHVRCVKFLSLNSYILKELFLCFQKLVIANCTLFYCGRFPTPGIEPGS